MCCWTAWEGIAACSAFLLHFEKNENFRTWNLSKMQSLFTSCSSVAGSTRINFAKQLAWGQKLQVTLLVKFGKTLWVDSNADSPTSHPHFPASLLHFSDLLFCHRHSWQLSARVCELFFRQQLKLLCREVKHFLSAISISDFDSETLWNRNKDWRFYAAASSKLEKSEILNHWEITIKSCFVHAENFASDLITTVQVCLSQNLLYNLLYI